MTEISAPSVLATRSARVDAEAPSHVMMTWCEPCEIRIRTGPDPIQVADYPRERKRRGRAGDLDRGGNTTVWLNAGTTDAASSSAAPPAYCNPCGLAW